MNPRHAAVGMDADHNVRVEPPGNGGEHGGNATEQSSVACGYCCTVACTLSIPAC